MSSEASIPTFSGSRPRVLARRSFSPRRAAKDPENAGVAAFRALVWKYWRKEGRHTLPWRKTKNPYRILVSEVMLQQTQVPRVIEKYKEFLEAFPDVEVLARAPLAKVLKVWGDLGYNRRAKYLRDAAISIIENHGGRVPKDAADLRALPGVGTYTASALRAFAFNEPDLLIETNIRTALIHHFYQGRSLVKDSDILGIAERAAEGQDPREWHWALMDYGAHLKRSGIRNNARSARHTKQLKFEGSLRQVRGAILRKLSEDEEINDLRNRYKKRYGQALVGLARDGLIVKEKGKWRIA